MAAVAAQSGEGSGEGSAEGSAEGSGTGSGEESAQSPGGEFFNVSSQRLASFVDNSDFTRNRVDAKHLSWA